MNQRAWLIIGLLLFGFTCTAQNKLLFHKNRFREAIYRIGDPLTFRIKSSHEKISGVIDAISDTSFVIDQVSHKPSDIDRIYIDKKTRVCFFLSTNGKHYSSSVGSVSYSSMLLITARLHKSH